MFTHPFGFLGITDLLFDVSGASYDSKSFDPGTQEANGGSLFIKPDGTKLYVAGGSQLKVFQYTMSTPWDISTASYDSKFFDASAQGWSLYGMIWKPDGTKFYILDDRFETVSQYSCSTAWDVSTASYDSKQLDITSEDSLTGDLYISDDGTKVYCMGKSTDTIYQYTMSTPWDISTASYDSKSFSVISQESDPWGLHFNGNGKQFLVCGANKTMYQYSMTTPFDISTASYDGKSFSMTSEMITGNPAASIFIKPELNKFYVIEFSSPIYQYSM